MHSPSKTNITELDLSEMETVLETMGVRRFHASQIYRWIHKRAVIDFSSMTDLSRELRHQLDQRFRISSPEIQRKDISSDGTTKFLLRLEDGQLIESVYIPEIRQRGGEQGDRMTFCISTQAGCAMKCGFCLTGKMGLVRHLTAGEIVGQVRVLARELGVLEGRFNIVLMGMGEPLHNYDNTMKALRMLADEHGLSISPRRVTLSTVGVVPGIERLATEPIMPNLAISLHGTTDAQRDALVPLNRKYGLDEVLEACRQFPLKRRSRITFEYVLLKDVNDAPEDARRLVRLLAGLRAKINLIPLNEAAGIPYERPSDERVDRFAQILADHHITVSVRKSRGRDIRAACGQLIVEGEEQSPAQRLAAAL
jgi:23S rRNA (adenine2503-C2)-methyltransferase